MSRITFNKQNIAETVRGLVALVNGKISLGTRVNPGNLAAVPVDFTVTGGNENTDQAVAHKLGRPPAGWIVVGQTVAGIVYDSSASPYNDNWSDTSIELRADTAGTYRLVIF